MSIIMTSYTFWMNFAFTFVTMADLLMQIDLICTLTKPLAPFGNRQIYYLATSIIYSLILAISLTVTMDLNNPLVKTLFYTLKALFFLSAIWSISASLIKFSRGGLSR